MATRILRFLAGMQLSFLIVAGIRTVQLSGIQIAVYQYTRMDVHSLDCLYKQLQGVVECSMACQDLGL